MNDVVVASACRTAIGAFGGTLKDMPAFALAAVTIVESLGARPLSPAETRQKFGLRQAQK